MGDTIFSYMFDEDCFHRLKSAQLGSLTGDPEGVVLGVIAGLVLVLSSEVRGIDDEVTEGESVALVSPRDNHCPRAVPGWK